MSNRQLGRDMQVEFQARFQAKQARREAQKAVKGDALLKKQIQELLKKGETQKAYQKAKVLLGKQAMAQRMDEIADMAELNASQIQANTAMNRMTHMMGQSTRVMNAAQKNSNPEKVSPTLACALAFSSHFPRSLETDIIGLIAQTLVTLEQYKQQNEEYSISNNIYQDAMMQSTSAQVPEDAVHELLGKLADDAGLELSKELNQATPANAEPAQTNEPTAEEEDRLQQRLRALRA